MKVATRSSSNRSAHSLNNEKPNTAVATNDKATPIKKSASTKQKSGLSTVLSSYLKDKKPWNDMSHLSLKRFAEDDPTLTAGARRDRTEKHPFVACAEVDPSGRALCKLCGDRIPKGALRLSLMLECHKGYRNQCTLHQECFWDHPETKKLTSVDEIVMQKGVDETQKQMVQDQFRSLRAGE